MKRSDLVIAVLAGAYGKPRPCLVVQSDRLARLESILVCPLTSRLDTAGPTRLVIAASAATGLAADSLIMVDKVTAIPRSRCADVMGVIDARAQERVDGLLMLVLGLAG